MSEARIEEAQATETTTIEAANAGERSVAVTIIRAGTSHNGLHYERDVLAASVPLWEGAAAFVDHPNAIDRTRAGGRSLRDLAGVYENARIEGDAVRADLRLYESADWAHRLIREAIADREAGRLAPDIGISADMRVRRRQAPAGSGATWIVEAISRVNSADLVFSPSAGGSFDRINEAEENAMPQAVTEQENAQTHEAGAAQAAAEAQDVASVLEAARSELAQITEARRQAAAEMLDAKLAGSRLPEKMRASIRKRIASRDTFTAAEVDAEIAEATDLLADLAANQLIAGVGGQRSSASVRSPLDKLQLALDRMFGEKLADADSDIPRLSGIREAYLMLTGDKGFTGRVYADESVLEANEVTTSVIANSLANSMTKRITHEYTAQPKWWDPIVIRTAISDLKQQQRIHLNDFAALSTVGENAAYTNLAWGDTRETYTPSKRGNMVVVTLESIINDDTRAITRIPNKLANTAIVTINEFISSLFTANAGAGSLLSDTFTVFDATNHQGNAGVAALSSAALQAALIAMLKFTNSASKRLGVQGRYLLLPPDLFYTGKVILNSELLPGGNNNDVNPVSGALTPINVPNWTDTNNWYVMADPAQVEGIELGFLNGREEPELLIQDGPTLGSVFTNDAISWKVRHIFGGGWLDFRASFGSIVP